MVDVVGESYTRSGLEDQMDAKANPDLCVPEGR